MQRTLLLLLSDMSTVVFSDSSIVTRCSSSAQEVLCEHRSLTPAALQTTSTVLMLRRGSLDQQVLMLYTTQAVCVLCACQHTEYH
jgi:hypothetical protein